MSSVTLRPCTEADGRALRPLTERDTARPLTEETVLVAERDGRLLAAVCLREGRVIADPFEPTAELVELLRLRAAQLRGEGRPRGPRARPLRSRPRAIREGAAPSTLPGRAAA